MTENNASQAAGKILTYLGFAQAMSMEPGVDRRRDHIQSLIESTLLSELRAEGVQAGAPMLPSDALDALRDFKLTVIQDGFHKIGKPMIQQLAQAGALESLGFGKHRVTEYGEWLLSSSSAALASAPVAGEAVAIPLRPLNEDERAAIEFYTLNPTAAVRDLDKRLSGNAAPQASAEPLARYCPGCGSVGPVGDEYRDCCPDGNQARMIPARLAEQCRDTFRLAIQTLLADAAANDRAAPRASEAVRILFPAHLRKMWSGGEVQTWLDEHQGITPPNASAKGSLEHYRKWQAEKTQADKDGCANG